MNLEILTVTSVTSTSEVFWQDVLHKSTFYLLTYIRHNHEILSSLMMITTSIGHRSFSFSAPVIWNSSLHLHLPCVLVAQRLGRQIFNQSGRRFDSRTGHYQATYVNSAFHPYGVGNWVPALLAGVKACDGWQVTLCDPIWQATDTL